MAKPDKQDYEKLFLIEVFLDSVFISTSHLELDAATKAKLQETCITFTFLEHPPLVLCEEDFSKTPPRRTSSDDLEITFKAGKSCMFSISSFNVPLLPYKFDVSVKVLRKLEENGETKKIVIGTSTINLGDSFSAIMHSSVTEADLPLARTNHGTFDVVDEKGRKIGAITGLVRLSCFGPLIITQFQVGEKDAFMFKGTEAKEIVEIPGDSSKRPKIEVDPNYQPPPQPRQPPEQQRPHGDWDGDLAPQYPRDGRVPMAPQQPPPPEEPGNYKEIVAEIRGHSLHIRVPMKPKKDKEMCKKQLEEALEGPICKYAPQPNFCDCDYPVPPESIPRCPTTCPF